jgi:hypothetical protein
LRNTGAQGWPDQAPAAGIGRRNMRCSVAPEIGHCGRGQLIVGLN